MLLLTKVHFQNVPHLALSYVQNGLNFTDVPQINKIFTSNNIRIRQFRSEQNMLFQVQLKHLINFARGTESQIGRIIEIYLS